jgi:hypothetical protein
LLHRGFVPEYVTLGWNVAGIVVLAVAARSVALAGFGLDSLVEIGASVVVAWQADPAAGTRWPATRPLRSGRVFFSATG